MSELHDQIAGDRGSFEQLLARIPGFRGYTDKASRRTADRMVRDYVADRLAERIDELTQVERYLLDHDGFAHMSATASVKTKLQTYRDRVATAAPGYSGFMEAIKVDADALDRLYSFDEAQARYADRFGEAIAALRTAAMGGQGVDEAIAAIDTLTLEANTAFSMREDVLTDLSKGMSAR